MRLNKLIALIEKYNAQGLSYREFIELLKNGRE